MFTKVYLIYYRRRVQRGRSSSSSIITYMITMTTFGRGQNSNLGIPSASAMWVALPLFLCVQQEGDGLESKRPELRLSFPAGMLVSQQQLNTMAPKFTFSLNFIFRSCAHSCMKLVVFSTILQEPSSCIKAKILLLM